MKVRESSMDNHQHYQKFYTFYCWLLLLMMIAILLCSMSVIITIVLRNDPAYYATGMDGTLVALFPLDNIQSFIKQP